MDSKKMKELDKVCQSLHKKHASQPHIFLQIVAVDPEVQGQGVAGKMMRAVSAIGDALKLPLYLECSGGGHEEAVYQKLGFTTSGKEDFIVKEKGKEDDKFEGGMLGT